MRYETFYKNEKNKFVFIGWGEILNEEFCIVTKETKKFIYKTYKWLNGKVEEYRYGKQGI